MRAIDMTGKRIGLLTVIGRVGTSNYDKEAIGVVMADRTFGYGKRRRLRNSEHRPKRQETHRGTQRMEPYTYAGRRYLSGMDARLAARDVIGSDA